MGDLRRKRLSLGLKQLLPDRLSQVSAPHPISRTILQTSSPSDEPRKRQRISLSVTFGVAEQTGSGLAVDLSTGGIGISSASAFFATGTKLQVNLQLPNSSPKEWLALRGVVCYGIGSRFGVRFVDLTPADETRILELLAKG